MILRPTFKLLSFLNSVFLLRCNIMRKLCRIRFFGIFLKIVKREKYTRKKKTLSKHERCYSVILVYSFENIHSSVYARVAEIKILGLLSVLRTKQPVYDMKFPCVYFHNYRN